MTGETTRTRVLVVEDNPDGARVMALLLRRSGYDAPIALDGPAALRQVEESPPDVVLLDIGLPGMDGWQVARRIRELHLAREPYFVAVTAYGTEEDYRRSADEGIHFHLVKPVKPELVKLVLERLPRRNGEWRRPVTADPSLVGV
jgi:CheY-like chemotaxis protein